MPLPIRKLVLSALATTLVVAFLYSLCVWQGGHSGAWLATLGVAVAGGVLWYVRTIRRIRVLEASQREFEAVYDCAPCGYHSLDAQGRVIRMNATEISWLGERKTDVLGRHYLDYVVPEHHQRFLGGFNEVTSETSAIEIECDLMAPGGQRTVLIRATAKTDDDDQFVHSRATVFDITERKRMEDKLQAMVRTDPLTGLGNRRYFEEIGERELARYQRTGSDLALATMDIDHFKCINDKYGHEAGDMVLKHFAKAVSESLRDGDLVCRLGGEEFSVLLPDTQVDAACEVMERVRKDLADASLEIEDNEGNRVLISYAVSFGVTCVRDEPRGIKRAVQRADRALYIAKEGGRNQVVKVP